MCVPLLYMDGHNIALGKFIKGLNSYVLQWLQSHVSDAYIYDAEYIFTVCLFCLNIIMRLPSVCDTVDNTHLVCGKESRFVIV